MAEYNEREAVASKAVYMHGFGENKYVPLRAVEGAPAADVAPVVHGLWILVAENSTGLIYQCSSCGKCNNPNDNDVAIGRVKEKPNYCPNCGARMDLEGGKDHG